MKRVICAFIITIIIFSGTVEATISESFQKVISMINIPSKNVDGYEINEEIYNKYGLIVYGSPYMVKKGQRWKDVSNGKWTNELTNKKGEYRILGYSLTGTVVNNEVFPDDYNSGISPEEWNYIPVEGALNSWNDTEKYQTREQYEYMLTQKLNRNGVTYNLTASSIGLDKARLEAYATWKTAGSIYTEKRNADGVIWEATFHIPAMAGDAKLSAKLNVVDGTTYKFNENQELLKIPINFGAEVTGLTEYARVEDIKKISSELEIQGEVFDKIQGEKVASVIKDNELVINKSDYYGTDKITIKIKNTSILETCFHAEAPMVDIKEATITIIFKEQEEEEFIKVENVNTVVSEEIPPPIITSINLYRKTISNPDKKQSLYVAKKTGVPFICAGQVLVVEANIKNEPTSVSFAIEGDSRIQKLDDLTKRFVYEEPKSRNQKLIYSSLKSLENSYKLPRKMVYESGVYKLEYVIPYGTKQSINSWATLREVGGNALEIDKNKMFTRITRPYYIKIKASNDGGTITKSIAFDVFERWDTIYNRNITEYVK